MSSFTSSALALADDLWGQGKRKKHCSLCSALTSGSIQQNFFLYFLPELFYVETRRGQTNVPKLQSTQRRAIREAEDVTQPLMETTGFHLPAAVCITRKSNSTLQQMSDSPCRKHLQPPYPWHIRTPKEL